MNTLKKYILTLHLDVKNLKLFKITRFLVKIKTKEKHCIIYLI